MQTPEFPQSRPLELYDKPLFDELFSQNQPLISEFTFAGLYLFRNPHNYRVSRIGGGVVILGVGYDGVEYAMPPLGDNSVDAAKTILLANIPIYGADEEFISSFEDKQNISIAEERDAFDYLYLREELANLPGNRFHKKKNRLQYFTSRHNYRTELFKSAYSLGCIELLNQLKQIDQSESRSYIPEHEAAIEALQMAEQLGLTGVVIFVDDKVKGFSLGEKLNHDTAVCHFEKGDHFLDGIMQLLNREFCNLLFPECTYINREQDLGIEGLRNAKLSYHPIKMIKKYRIEMGKQHIS